MAGQHNGWEGLVMDLNRNATPGYRAIMEEFRMGDTAREDAVAFLFALAEVTWAYYDEILPDFQPSPLSIPADPENIHRDKYPDAAICDMHDDGLVTNEDMRKAHAVLSRYADLRKIAESAE
jgi:hypothetical protein